MLKKVMTTFLSGIASAATICLLTGCRTGGGGQRQEKEMVSDSSGSQMKQKQAETSATDRHLRFHEEK